MWAHVENVALDSGNRKFKPHKVDFLHSELDMVMENGLAWGMFSDSLNKSASSLVCKTGSMYYSSSGCKQQSGHRFLLALRNLKTNKIKLVEATKVSLAPVVEFPYSSNLLLQSHGNDESNQTRSLSKEFVHRFGMLRGQRLYDQAERLTVKADNVKANLQHAAISADIQESELQLIGADLCEHMLPRRNLLANKASEVYKIEDLVSAEDFIALDVFSKSLLSDDGAVVFSEDNFSLYFWTQLLCVKQSQNMEEAAKLRMLQSLLYAECLIKLATTKGNILKGIKELHSAFPSDVKARMIEKFASENAMGFKSFGNINRERVIIEVIIIALILGDCCFNAEILSKSLKIDLEKLGPLIRVVGARMVKLGDKQWEVRLTLPLLQPSKKPLLKRRGGNNAL